MKPLAAIVLVMTTVGLAAPATATPTNVTGNFNVNRNVGGPVLSPCQLNPRSRACSIGNQPSAAAQPQTRQPVTSHPASQRRPTRR